MHSYGNHYLYPENSYSTQIQVLSVLAERLGTHGQVTGAELRLIAALMEAGNSPAEAYKLVNDAYTARMTAELGSDHD